MSALLTRAADKAEPKRFLAEPAAVSAFAPLSPRIVTRFVNPPVPFRHSDWEAHFDGQEDGPIGYGETEERAIDDLHEFMAMRDELQADKRDGERARYGRGSGE